MNKRSRIGRRELLQIGGISALGLSLSQLADGQTPEAEEAAQGSLFGRAKNIIWLYMSGGPSHIDLFDPKPSLKQFAGQRPAGADLRTERVTGGLLPAPWKFRPGGESGLLGTERAVL